MRASQIYNEFVSLLHKNGGMGKGKTRKIGRDARTGRFISLKEANRRKNTAVVETIKKK